MPGTMIDNTNWIKREQCIVEDIGLFHYRKFKVYNSVAKRVCRTPLKDEQKKIILSKINAGKISKYMINITEK